MTRALDPDVMDTPPENTARRIVYARNPVLRPGIDYQGGVVYITTPASGPVTKTTGKGKTAKTTEGTEDFIAVVTSDRSEFVHDIDELRSRGFSMPTTVTRAIEARWSPESIDAFLDGTSDMPDPAALFMALKTVYEHHIEFSNPLYEDVMALYVMGSYMFELFPAVGYIHFNGTAASGKSQNLRILSALGLNTIWSSSMTQATLFRQVSGNAGIMCVDEAEDWTTEKAMELKAILNAGYKSGNAVHRTEKVGDRFQVMAYDTFGPKVIASIAPLDPVLQTRALVVSMRPALRPIPEFREDDPRWGKLRDQLYLWAMYHTDAVAALAKTWDEKRAVKAPDLVHRMWETTQMLVILSDYIDPSGDLTQQLVALFNQYFTELQKKQDADDKMRLLLLCLPEVLRTKAAWDGHWYAIKDIHEVASTMLETDQVEYFKTRTVSKYLDVLGFKTKRPHKSGSQILLTPEAVRETLIQRRVSPTDENDLAWLRGERDLPITPTAVLATTQAPMAASVWDQRAATEDLTQYE